MGDANWPTKLAETERINAALKTKAMALGYGEEEAHWLAHQVADYQEACRSFVEFVDMLLKRPDQPSVTLEAEIDGMVASLDIVRDKLDEARQVLQAFSMFLARLRLDE